MGFGSNIGNGAANFDEVIRRFAVREIDVLRISSLYETEPWGGAEGGPFTNAVMEVARGESPRSLWNRLCEIETLMGRERRRPLEPRTCDLDLLLWGDAVVDEPDLRVPHPRMAQRKFVLVPLCELIPDEVHPELGCTFTELLRTCTDPLQVWLRDRPHGMTTA